VARYSTDHKEATRQRIIESAGRRFKETGVDGSGIATLMSDAGLTNGAFYAHFESKDDLVASVVADELRRQADTFADLPAGRAGLRDFVPEYLSAKHRDSPASAARQLRSWTRSRAPRTRPRRATPTVRSASWTRSPLVWLLATQSLRAARPSRSTR